MIPTCVRSAVAAVAVAMLGDIAPAQESNAPAEHALIAKLIPVAPGKKACFAGTFRSVPVDTERYGTGSGPNEPVPIIYTTHKVQSVVLRLEYDRTTPPRPTAKDDPGYDRRYMFALSARFAGRVKPQFAAGDCPWHDRDKEFESQRGTFHLPRNTTAIHCGIDCDGGSMSLVRVPGTSALTFRIDPRRHLRLTAPCGDDDKSLVLSGRDAGIALRLEPADALACRALERWSRRGR
jgi:hypothetical protein